MLFGEEDFAKLQAASVIILGVGGVGSYALDCLYRSGVGHITILDYDTYDITNQNRQIGAEAIGGSKIEHLQTLYPGISIIHQQMDLAWLETFDFYPYDIIIDAADTTRVKIELAKREYKKLIMSLGSAKRYDSSQIEVASIWKSHGDALGVRYAMNSKKQNLTETLLWSSPPSRQSARRKALLSE
jgi:tRNA A37 threonylcarbamoyladenosine dehydratase